jgi:ATP-dependent exoDNAse (exonuclease V) alpha subunit
MGTSPTFLPSVALSRNSLQRLCPVLTVHKAQGSQWDDVVLFDESAVFQEHGGRWLYTGVTRAAKRLTVVV